MLAPRERQTLLANLRPPEGFRVDSVIATTFTLDLTALLVAPLAFSLLDAAVASDSASADGDLDPYALLRAARDHAERMAVFCDATRIANPAKYRPLFTYLEKCVVQVCARHDEGVFHPKVWVLRFVSDDEPVRYRLLCSSRNLTFDQSWDTLLTLDGELTDRTNAIAANRPLSEFVAELPKLAMPRSGISKERAKMVARAADELLRVRFEPPDGVESMAFHPLGIEGYLNFRMPGRVQRALVVSPFVDGAGLKPWGAAGKDHVLVGRVDQLDAIDDATLSRFPTCSVLQEALESEEGESDLSDGPEVESTPTGLHAKLFVVDDGWEAHVWTGSANATGAGFAKNVEFMVQLSGKKSSLGVQSFLDRGLGEMTRPYVRGAAGMTSAERELERRLCRLRRRLAEAEWIAKVGERTADGYPFALSCVDGRCLPSEPVQVRPITLAPAHARTLVTAEPVVEFGPCSLEAITCFFAVHVKLEGDGAKLEADFVLKARLEGAPLGREEQVLAAMFKEPAEVLRFLGMLLAEDPVEWLAADGERRSHAGVAARSGAFEGAFLERLLRALHANPRQLDSVERFIAELSSTGAGSDLVTTELRALWKSVDLARKHLDGGAR